jgi:microcystin-dependent protein
MTGEIVLWPVATIPSGWLTLNGQAVSRSTYSALFAILGTLNGAGDGSTTFNLPNWNNKVPVGADGNTGGLPTSTLLGGATGGASSVNTGAAGAHTPAGTLNNAGSHNHGGADATTLSAAQMPQHNHTTAGTANRATSAGTQIIGGGTGGAPITSSFAGSSSSHTHSITSDGTHTHTFTGTAVADHTHTASTVQPGAAGFFIIKT